MTDNRIGVSSLGFAGLREGSEDTAIWLSRYEHNI
ncbi:hypothetical protein ACR8HX_19365, partial [Salmonella enterica subsp. enterica serovar Paratyphi A]